jgi:hypothetical protein
MSAGNIERRLTRLEGGEGATGAFSELFALLFPDEPQLSGDAAFVRIWKCISNGISDDQAARLRAASGES